MTDGLGGRKAGRWQDEWRAGLAMDGSGGGRVVGRHVGQWMGWAMEGPGCGPVGHWTSQSADRLGDGLVGWRQVGSG